MNFIDLLFLAGIIHLAPHLPRRYSLIVGGVLLAAVTILRLLQAMGA